ncbi:probable alkaline/neutral invertase B isoform X2 [Salvia hispanica]|uniref:probable alkaline/neutral invertase B isoform X2 n=1 Tax=Salvia hispanica TaxID=49212 RepID=UPI002009BB08|nr:probable alkaline/neutral invertase B isoform X2 [Salvia hispanica]
MSSINVEVLQNGSVNNGDSIINGGHELDEYDFSRLVDRPRLLNLERQRSCDEKSLNDFSVGFSPHPSSRADNFSRAFDNLDSLYSPGCNTPMSHFGYGMMASDPHPMIAEAWDDLRRALVYFRGQPVGTIAALDSSDEKLNYDQVFVRDFVPSALAFLMNGEPEVVKNFLLKTLRLQGWEKKIDRFQLGEGVMPASFKVLHDPVRNTETLMADFGETAIGRVAPVDSGFWWIILLRAYTKSTGDTSLADKPECQKGIRLILSLCLSEGFDTFPTLLCADGCSMIDRRMGVYGYPIEIQALFFMALRCAMILLKHDGPGKELIERIVKRLHALSYHMRNYFWLDLKQLNDIYRYKTEEYSHTAVNKFNVMPDSLPDWVMDFMPLHGGYFIGNIGPSHMDFRWFCLGNCIAILSSLATQEQSSAIMDLIESRWEELVGDMPLKVCYPAIEHHEWRIVTGCDPKNTRWSYHNGGSWPACIKTGRPQIARRAIELAETRLSKDGWPEYYDGKQGRYIGKQARKHQTWSVAGYLVAKMLLEDPSHLGMIAIEEDKHLKPVLRRSSSWTA